jgi:hypothetical protein
MNKQKLSIDTIISNTLSDDNYSNQISNKSNKTSYSDTNSIYNDIFKSDKDNSYINIDRNSIQSIYTNRDKDNNIYIQFLSNEPFEWETNIYLILVDTGLVPLASSDNNKLSITYNTSDMIPLKKYLKNLNYKDTIIVLHEIYSYVQSFNKHKFVHGNLHIDNILIDKYSHINNLSFYIIDFSNSYTFHPRNINKLPSYTRSSFLKEYKSKTKLQNLMFWDYFTLYVSLKLYFNKNTQITKYLDNLIFTYLKPDIRDKFITMLKKLNTTWLTI